MTSFTPWTAALGGALIGLAATLLLLTHGRIAGVSGIAGGLLTRPAAADVAWRVAFVLGLASAGAIAYRVAPSAFDMRLERAPLTLVCAGLLVGFGTRLGNGCTSGHGVCGVARMSRRSLVATVVFIAIGMATVFLFEHVIGGKP